MHKRCLWMILAAATGFFVDAHPSHAASSVEQRLAVLEARVRKLEAQNARLSDYNEIMKLQALYAHYINLNASEKIVELFANSDEVEIEVSNKGVLVGRTAPVRWRFGDSPNPDRSEQPRAPGQMSMHVSDNPVLEIDPTGVHARAVWLSPGISTLRLARDGGVRVTGMWNWGKYEMEYLKQNGKWKILKLRYHQIFLTPYDKGWTVESDDPDTTRERVKPDRPSAPDFYNPYHVDRSNSMAPPPPDPYPIATPAP
jgi:hypothetical protein